MSSKRAEMASRMSLSLARKPQATPAAGEVRPEAPRVAPVRITVDLEPTLHRQVKRWAFEAEVPIAEVVRVLLTRLTSDAALSASVLEEIRARQQ